MSLSAKYDIAVVGAGPAGCMAAICAARFKRRILLVERNSSIGKKIYLTGKGRCNITNTASVDVFVEKFGKTGKFLRTAFSSFFNKDLVDFFKENGLGMIAERQGRVFPEDHKSESVVKILDKVLKKSNVKTCFNSRVVNIERTQDAFALKVKTGKKESYTEYFFKAKKVILTTGGGSYRDTGSTGDGFRIAKEMGHKLTLLRPALVPLRTREKWVKDLQGLALKNVRVTFLIKEPDSRKKPKKVVSSIGEVMFTHFGISGPLILDLSGEITRFLAEKKDISLLIDLKPGLDAEKLNKRLMNEFETGGNRNLDNIMKGLLPLRLAPVFLQIVGIEGSKKGNQITKKERYLIAEALKAFPLTITESLALNRGMVTEGGVSKKKIDPRTMESKIIKDLYFAGELIEGRAPSGGYNLQQAFSTGYLAGKAAAQNA